MTSNGKAKPVVQGAEAYQVQLDRVGVIEGIQRGRADVKAGRREATGRARLQGHPDASPGGSSRVDYTFTRLGESLGV